jgi:DNA mismatch endonuclease (patch repair protein)
LPGRPDIVIKKHKVAIFVNGCFWHGHEGCRYFRLPATNPEFWRLKISGNRDRDARKIQALRDLGWRVVVVWECAVRSGLQAAVECLTGFIASSSGMLEIAEPSVTRDGN